MNITRIENKLIVLSQAVGVSAYDFDFPSLERSGKEVGRLICSVPVVPQRTSAPSEVKSLPGRDMVLLELSRRIKEQSRY